MTVWTIVDAVGNALGPLWPDALDHILDCLYNLLYVVGQVDCSTLPQHIITLVTGLCE